MNQHPTRREWMQRTAMTTLGLTAASLSAAQSPPRTRALRIAHVTDIHVEPVGKSPDGMARCLEHIHTLKDRPDLILNGGDSIMDASGRDRDRVQAQWDIWDRILSSHCRLPIFHCIGNHDVWGLDRVKSKTTGDEPLYGKKWAMERFGLKERFYSFDRAGWHFVVLDSTTPQGSGYTARLDDPQMEWLAADLAAVSAATPILVLSHIPILCGCAFLDGNNEKTGNWVVPGAWMHIDARRIKDLFYRHPNVRLALSGHIHLQDRLDYNRVTYLCNGAVSGAWWNGNYQETEPGYGLIDLYTDGSFDHQYVVYDRKTGA
ncbi:MAG: metallophosphoesterase [Chloroherpetonaceae bacterium]|nr:metallophosphoesterase [Chthonomonadaceae bacterium]MDW8208130.1 metallophosphoesterase [Chloroherpetonaceae bacterium]